MSHKQKFTTDVISFTKNLFTNSWTAKSYLFLVKSSNSKYWITLELFLVTNDPIQVALNEYITSGTLLGK